MEFVGLLQKDQQIIQKQKLALDLDKLEQTEFTKQVFKREEDILLFQHDLTTVSRTCDGWSDLLHTTGKSIITEFNTITHKEIMQHKMNTKLDDDKKEVLQICT